MDHPTTEGLEATDCTGVVKGNADLQDQGQWSGTPATADGHEAPLPGYPTKDQLRDGGAA